MCSHWFEEARLKWLNRIQLIKVETIRQRVPELLLGADPLDSLLECYSAGAQEKTEENLRSHVTTHEQSLTQLPQESGFMCSFQLPSQNICIHEHAEPNVLK